jgi:hypothetical protein
VKYHSETPLNNHYILFKMQDKKVKQVLSWGGYQSKGGRQMERVKEGDYG